MGSLETAASRITMRCPTVEVETWSEAGSLGGSGSCTPTQGDGRDTHRRLLKWAIQVEVQRVLGPERRVSRMEREEELIQRAMRKKSRKVSREGDFLVFVEKKGVLTTQNGTQQINETRIKIGGKDMERLEELGL